MNLCPVPKALYLSKRPYYHILSKHTQTIYFQYYNIMVLHLSICSTIFLFLSKRSHLLQYSTKTNRGCCKTQRVCNSLGGFRKIGPNQNVGVVEADSIRQSSARRECGQIISAPTRNRKTIDCLYNRYANPNIY